MYKNYFLKGVILISALTLIYVAFTTTTGNHLKPLDVSFVEGEEWDTLIQGLLKQENSTWITDLIFSQGVLHPPPSPHIPYNLITPENIDPSKGQSQVVQKIFNKMRNGFFVECGALDGETRSNTLALERDYNWTGLLIEGDPSNFELVKTKNRKSWTANCCLAVHPYPHKVLFQQDFNAGKIIVDHNNKIIANEAADETKESVSVQCFPIFSLLSAINVTTVDYFSLDVEGHELKVLKTIPFDLVYIKVFSVEFFHTDEGENFLQKFMISKGYRVVTKVVAENNFANDFIFVHRDFKLEGEFRLNNYNK